MINLEKGIEFEDNKAFLEWNNHIDILFDKYGERKENKTDRTIYHWGNHYVLNGLELYLTNSYWNFGKEKNKRTFDSIEFWVIGDKESQNYFDTISNHLIKHLGNPTEKEGPNKPEKEWIWNLGKIGIRLYFFEQHCYKLHFEIKKI